MNSQELISALRKLKVETGSLACWGCGHEHNCGIHGCRVMRGAADEIEKLTDRCARYAEEIAALQERARWIPVTERLPEAGETVLAVVYGRANANVELIGAIELAVRRKYGWLVEAWPDLSGTVTHWLPLPAGPEVE